MDPYFDKKSVLVTGAASGIGKTITQKLSALGATVYALDINENGLNNLVKECPSVRPIVVNLTDWDQTKNAVEKIECLDMVVNNAGIMHSPTSFLDIDKSVFDKVLSIDLMAAINISQTAGKMMMASDKRGSIVNISSTAAFVAYPKLSPICIAKAALNMATKCMATELAPNIRVNAVNPSTTLTDIVKSTLSKLMPNPKGKANEEKMKARHSMGRYAETDEVADAVLFLLSDKSSYMTGHCMPVDGGFLCN